MYAIASIIIYIPAKEWLLLLTWLWLREAAEAQADGDNSALACNDAGCADKVIMYIYMVYLLDICYI